MESLHWVALLLGMIGITLVIIGVQQQRASRPATDIVGGFGGPAGSSDLGSSDGFDTTSPTAHYPVGRVARLAGLALTLAAVVLAIIAELT